MTQPITDSLARSSDEAFVVIDDVSFAYPGSPQPILRDVSLTLRRGEFFVLLGPSGCGKTTILNQVAGFERPSTGAISVNGEPITRPGPDRAVIFQGDDSCSAGSTSGTTSSSGCGPCAFPPPNAGSACSTRSRRSNWTGSRPSSRTSCRAG